jgi:signal transduction histidine kinase
MKKTSSGIFRRIGILIFIIVSGLSILFIIVTYMATVDYYRSSTQILNRDVAAHIAKFSSPYGPHGINKKKADSVFYNAMIVSPNVEVYFLDTTGKVLYYHAADSLIKVRQVPLENIRQYLQTPTTEITDVDPKDPDHPKIFSAAEVWSGKKMIGYIYVILISKQYRNVADIVFKSKAGGLAIKVFCIIILTTVIFGLLYTSRLQSRFNRVIAVLERFKDGDLNVRFDTDSRDEFYPISDAFNKMAVMLEANFKQQKELENERQNFLVNISHDLRTPLAVARGYAETMLLENPGYTSREKQHLELILGKIQMVEKLVLQLFELSKTESVSFVPLKEPFIFSEILQENLAGTQLQANRKKVALMCLDCEDTSYINADAGMMERVIQNLLENAVKYTAENGNITVRLAHGPGSLLLHIANTGLPLSDELIFWINDQEASGLTNRPANTGLGLALVKSILKLHGFKLTAGVSGSGQNFFTVKMTVFHTGQTL